MESKHNILTRMVRINSEILELLKETEDQQLQLDLIRVSSDLKLAIDNYYDSNKSYSKSRYRLKQAKVMLENVENLLVEIMNMED